MIRRPLQRLVRPGRPRPHPAARWPGPGQPRLDPSCRFAAARADRTSPAVGAACRRRVTAASDGARRPSRLRGAAAAGTAGAERPSSAAAETTCEPQNQPMSRRPLQRLVRPGRPRPHAADATAWPGPTPPLRFAGLRGRSRRQRSRAVGAACRRRVTASRGAAPPSHPHAPAACGALKAERPSSAAAETAYRAAQPPHDTPSAAAPGSAGASWATPAADRLTRPNPTSPLRAPSRPPAPTGLRGPSGPRAGGA